MSRRTHLPENYVDNPEAIIRNQRRQNWQQVAAPQINSPEPPAAPRYNWRTPAPATLEPDRILSATRPISSVKPSIPRHPSTPRQPPISTQVTPKPSQSVVNRPSEKEVLSSFFNRLLKKETPLSSTPQVPGAYIATPGPPPVQPIASTLKARSMASDKDTQIQNLTEQVAHLQGLVQSMLKDRRDSRPTQSSLRSNNPFTPYVRDDNSSVIDMWANPWAPSGPPPAPEATGQSSGYHAGPPSVASSSLSAQTLPPPTQHAQVNRRVQYAAPPEADI